jgi:hypothetical protein
MSAGASVLVVDGQPDRAIDRPVVDVAVAGR